MIATLPSNHGTKTVRSSELFDREGGMIYRNAGMHCPDIRVSEGALNTFADELLAVRLVHANRVAVERLGRRGHSIKHQPPHQARREVGERGIRGADHRARCVRVVIEMQTEESPVHTQSGYRPGVQMIDSSLDRSQILKCR